MSAITDKIKALQQELARTGVDLTKTSGGDGFEAMPIGLAMLRFISYVEVGVHETKFQGQPKIKPRAQFTFEVLGKKYPAITIESTGRVIPRTITFTEVIGNTPKNQYAKLFKAMTADFPNAKSFVDLLGNAYLGTISHYKFKGNDGKDRVIAQLKGDSGYTIKSTTYESLNEETQETELKTVAVPKALSPLQVFLWDYADVEQWDSIYIDGKWDNGDTKNKVQEKIKAAQNFIGSPIYNELIEAGREAETEPFKKAEEGGTDLDEPEEPPEEPVKKAVKPAAKPAAKTPVKAAAKPAAKAAKAAEADDADPLAGL